MIVIQLKFAENYNRLLWVKPVKFSFVMLTVDKKENEVV